MFIIMKQTKTARPGKPVKKRSAWKNVQNYAYRKAWNVKLKERNR